MGNVAAHFSLGCLFIMEMCRKRHKKGSLSLVKARGILALHEKIECRRDRTAKHFIIAANLGCDLFVAKIVSKEDATALYWHWRTNESEDPQFGT